MRKRWRQRLPEYERKTLRAMNAVRKALGRKPRKSLPKGKGGDPRYCPLANCLRLSIPPKLRGAAAVDSAYIEVSAPHGENAGPYERIAEQIAKVCGRR